MITREQISQAPYKELLDIEGKLIVDKMKLDKFFSIFLDNAEMTEEDTNTPEWITYREMMKEYNRVDQLIAATKYHINKYVKHPSIQNS